MQAVVTLQYQIAFRRDDHDLETLYQYPLWQDLLLLCLSVAIDCLGLVPPCQPHGTLFWKKYVAYSSQWK